MPTTLLDRLQKEHGAEFHPAMLLAQVIEDKDEDIKLRVDCAKTLMPYIEATKKSVEHKGKVDTNFGLLRVSVYDDGNEAPSLPGTPQQIVGPEEEIIDVEAEQTA